MIERTPGLTDAIITPDQGKLIWFAGRDRVEPGHFGISVLAAHVTYLGEPEVFSDLGHVDVGDPIAVEYAVCSQGPSR